MTDSLASDVPTRPALLVAALQRAALLLVMVPVLLVIMGSIADVPRPTLDGWKRVAMVGVPLMLASALLDASAERAQRVALRAYGNGMATAIILVLLISAERIAGGADLQRLLTRALVMVPVGGVFLGLPVWVQGTYLAPKDQA